MRKFLFFIICVLLLPTGAWTQVVKTPSQLIWHNSTYLNTDSSLFTGALKTTYPDGKIKLAVNITNGKANGTLKLFFPNGQTHMLIGYEAGIPKGGFSAYFFNGELKFQCNLKGPAVGGGTEAELIRYAYYEGDQYINRTKVFGKIHFFNQHQLGALFNKDLAPHTIVGFSLTDRNKRSLGIFIEDSRKIQGPPNRNHWDGKE